MKQVQHALSIRKGILNYTANLAGYFHEFLSEKATK